MQKQSICLLISAILVSACSQGDVTEGEARAVTCLACHGGSARSTMPNIPRIAGQSQYYLAKQLRDYRDGSRTDPTMSALAASLDDETIEDLAAYFSSAEVWDKVNPTED